MIMRVQGLSVCFLWATLGVLLFPHHSIYASATPASLSAFIPTGATNVFRTTPSHASRQRPPLLALRAGVGEKEKEQEQEKDNPGKALLRGLMGAVEAMGGSMIDYRTPEERGEEEGGSASADGKEKAKEEEEADRKIERVTSESVEELGQVTAAALDRVSEKVSELVSQIKAEAAAGQNKASKQKQQVKNAPREAVNAERDEASLQSEEARSEEARMEEWGELHVRAVTCLVSSVKEDAPVLSLSGGEIRLPPAHVQALLFLGRTLKQVQEGGGKAAACFKWVSKKHGLNRYLSRLETENTPPSFSSPRDRLLLCRDIERALSEALLFLASLSSLPSDTRPDFLESVRSVLEHTPVRHRHSSLLSLASYYRKHASASPPSSPLALSLRRSFPSSSFSFSTSAPRTAFPILEAAHRALKLERRKTTGASTEAEEEEEEEEEEEGGGGVGGFLGRLTGADAAGHTAQALQRWAEGGISNALLDKEHTRQTVLAQGWRSTSAVTKSPLALQVYSYYANVPAGSSPPSQKWSAALLAVGAHVRAMAMARDAEGRLLEGRALVEAVNAQMMVTCLGELDSETGEGLNRFVSQMVEQEGEEGNAWREGREMLSEGLRRVMSEREGEGKEDDGSMRRVGGEGGRESEEERVERGLSRVLWEWRQPSLLLQLPLVLAADPEAYRLAITFLRCILLSDGEGLEKTRFQHPLNREHLAQLDPQVVKRWEELDNVTPAEFLDGDGGENARFGTRDAQALLMMGEDAGTCMAIHPTNRRTVKGLLGYLLQGNARMLCCAPSVSPHESEDVRFGTRGVRWGSRAIARLLLRRDTGETILFVDRPYHVSDRNATAEAELWGQAEALAKHLQVKLLRPYDAAPPDAVLENLRPPTTVDSYPFPAIELLEAGGVSPFVWRDGRFHVGLLYRGEEAKTALGGSRIAVGVLFGGWSDDLGAYQQHVTKSGGGGGQTAADMSDVQAIGAAIATHVRGTRTLEKKKKLMPWELTF